MKGVRDGDPATIGKRRDDKSRCSAHVLITVVQDGADLFDLAILAIGDILLPVVSQLLHPLEVID